jgi:hypothetical protein
MYFYFDPLRALDADIQVEWRMPEKRETILASLPSTPKYDGSLDHQSVLFGVS